MPLALIAPTIKSLSSDQAAAWDNYVLRSPLGTFCHLSGWGRAVERTWHHAAHHLYAERDQSLVGLLPLFHVRSRLFGSMLVSSPNASYGGALADDDIIRGALVAAAKQLAIQLQVGYLELRNSWEQSVGPDPELRPKALYVTFERRLCENDEDRLRGFPKKIRYMLRKAEQHGLRSELGRAELLDDFYSVFTVNMRKLGTPVFPKRLFAELLREFPDSSDLLVARHGARVAGATMNFYFRDAVQPYYAAADPAFYPAGISNFMFAELMRHAAARGFRRFDFGRSKLKSGSWAFKRTWKMSERPLPYTYFLVRSRQVPDLNPANPRFRLLISAWQRLPIGLTKLLGPAIVRGIP